MTRVMLLIAISFCWSSCAAFGQEVRPGPLMLMGGFERPENSLVWEEFVTQLGGPGRRVAVLAAASADPEYYGRKMMNHLKQLGLKPELIPSGANFSSDFRVLLNEPDSVTRVLESDAIFLLGGDQSSYRHFLIHSDGSDSPMLKAIREVHRRGGLIAGTSAGTAVMSRIMFVDGQSPYFMLKKGLDIDKELGQGFGFLPDDWFVDQHFLARGRLARMLVAMQKVGFQFGLGVDEDSAITIDGHGQAHVVGTRGVLVVDASQAEIDTNATGFNWQNLRLSYLSHGDQMDLATRQIKISPHRENERKVQDDASRDVSEPSVRVYHDIFHHVSLPNLMFDVLQDPSSNCVGLCLSQEEDANDETQDGFQLCMTTTAESVAREGFFGFGDPISVLHIRADISPIRVKVTRHENSKPKP